MRALVREQVVHQYIKYLIAANKGIVVSGSLDVDKTKFIQDKMISYMGEEVYVITDREYDYRNFGHVNIIDPAARMVEDILDRSVSLIVDKKEYKDMIDYMLHKHDSCMCNHNLVYTLDYSDSTDVLHAVRFRICEKTMNNYKTLMYTRRLLSNIIMLDVNNAGETYVKELLVREASEVGQCIQYKAVFTIDGIGNEYKVCNLPPLELIQDMVDSSNTDSEEVKSYFIDNFIKNISF